MGSFHSTETTPFTDCVKAVPVKIQKKKKGGGWKNVGTTTTDDTGTYSPQDEGQAGQVPGTCPRDEPWGPLLLTDCLKAKSATRTIK